MRVFSIIILLISTSYFVLAQNKYSFQIECVTVETNNSVTIKIWNTKSGKKYKQEQAGKDAIVAVLFSGIPGNNGCVVQKPILTTQEEKNNFNKIEKSFFSKNGNWNNYVREATTSNTLPVSINEKGWKVYIVSVSKDMLRKYLEEQKIIKSLNTGF